MHKAGGQASHGQDKSRPLGLAQDAIVGSDLIALTVENCPGAVAVLDRDARYLMTSGRWLADLGIAERDVIGQSHFELVPETSAAWKAAFERCVKGSVEQVEEERFVRTDRELDWIRWELHAWHTAAGDVGGVVVFAERTAERRRVHEELQRSAESVHLALTGAKLGTGQWNVNAGELTWSEHSYAIFGLPLDMPLSYEGFIGAVHPDDRERVQAAVQRSLDTRGNLDIEFRNVWPDGSVHWTSTKGLAFYDPRGPTLRMMGIATDITPQKEADRALSESEERYRMLAEGMPHLLWQLDAEGSLVYANRGWKAYFGREKIALFQWNEVVHPDDLERVTASWPLMMAGETDIAPFRLRRIDGVYRWFTVRTVPVRDAGGNVVHVIGISTDVEDVVRTQGALHISQARLDTALRAAGMGTWVWEVDTDRMHWDEALAQLLGAELGAPQTMEQLISLAIPDDRPVIERALQRTLSEGELDVEYRLPGPLGRLRWVAAKGRLESGPQGSPRRVFGACVEVTQHRRLEEDLRQAQKMEAIGQLAGGVAHDFNNLLTVILGQVGIAELSGALPAATRRALDAIGDAAERAASLTAQLLAFGRRQAMNARDIRLDELVPSITSMLTRVLGEKISLSFKAGDGPGWVHADPNMVTQILMNLTINARDAMPGGGELLIQMRTVHRDQVPEPDAQSSDAADYVCLSVTDSGEGIPPAVLPHIFEPFFTTKEPGRGTGLGLATVYGIVKQHHGFISVDSVLGKGSVFNVFLPKVQATATVRPAPSPTPTKGRGQLILLVEDEPGVRSVVKTILESNGYRLLVAANSQEALSRWADYAATLELLVTDVVMPSGLDGCELAARFQTDNPKLKIVLCSGYSAANVAKAMDRLERAVFLQKPYRPDQLLEVVGQLLDRD